MTLQARDVRKTYGGVTALDGVDLTVSPGTCHCLTGPNGSGKTTLLRVFLGLTEPDAGAVSVPDGATVGVSFQAASVFEALTVRDNLATFARDSARSDAAWRERVLADLDLTQVAHRPAGALSVGFRKRLDLALGLLSTPTYLLVDEPLADLDADTRAAVVDLLGDYPEDDRAVLIATHDPDAFAHRCDRMTHLRDGEVVPTPDANPPTDSGPGPTSI